MLLAACSTDDTMDEDVSAKAVSFDCAIYDENSRDGAPTRAGGDPSRELLMIQNTGFSVFASHGTAETLDFMFGQEVTYHNPAYPVVGGHWEYAPLKYWPTPLDASHPLHFHAFAPYADITVTDSGQAGIYEVGCTTGSNPAPQLKYRNTTATANLHDNLLLYAYQTVTAPSLTFTFRHALARVGVQMRTDCAPAAGTKILVESLTLSGTVATEGTLTIGSTPSWSVTTTGSRTFTISNSSDNAEAYAFLHNDVRYVGELPARWQPAKGLDETATSVLTLGDYAAYIYLIPQTTELTLTCTVTYRVCNPAADTVGDPITRTCQAQFTPTTGSTTNLNLKLTI